MNEMNKRGYELVFEPGELFIYHKAPGVYELGVVKRDRGDGSYACYYSQGYACHVPDCFRDLRVIRVRNSYRGFDIEVCDV